VEPILSVRELTRSYPTRTGEPPLTVLHPLSFDLLPGDTAAIVGPSGSGKTTLLGLCAGLDRPTAGDVVLCGQSLARLTEDQRAQLRGRHVGFVFQNFQLLPTLTALENVLAPLELQGNRTGAADARQWLDRVGLGARINHYPAQLSGGEQQRVALARAFAGRPSILFADEPTGNLDADTADAVQGLLFGLNAETGATLVLVTHDLDLAARTGRVLRLRGGRVVSDTAQAPSATAPSPVA